MRKIIAQCNTNPRQQNDFTFLKGFLPDYEIMYGIEALALIRSKEISAKNVLVIQECNSKIGRNLRKKGAIPFLNFCFESQLYANVFYSKLNSIAPEFINRIYFKGMFKNIKTPSLENNFETFYPAITNFETNIDNWKDREFAVIVVGNKFVEQENLFPKATIKINEYLKWFTRLFYETKTRKFLRENQLQDNRLKIIEYFGSIDSIKMYGSFWDKLEELPLRWQKRLSDIIKKLNPKPVDDKISTISNFKFNFAIENMRYEGYVTEKIIDSIVAGSIPVYLGAPDITDFVPKECFIDIRDFETIEKLHEYMKNLTEEQAKIYLENGQQFLKSENGQKFSMKYYSELVAKLVRNYEAKS